MKKIYLIIILIIALYSIYFCKNYDKFKNLNIKFEKSIFQIHSQNIKFNWVEPFKYHKSYESIGTGFLIDKKGYILTCSHVINNSIRVFVSLPAIGKKTFEAEVINFCPRIDIALLKIKDNEEFIKNFNNKLNPLKLGNSDKITPGEKLLALGYPLGEDKLKRTSGIISGIQDGRIQTDTPMNAGNSGGPLINRQGEVIGINFAIHKKGINIGYAVPINQYHILENILKRKRKDKIIHIPTLGITTNNSNLDMNKYLTNNIIKNGYGYYISEVFKNSTLHKVGVRNGDLLISFNNNKLDNFGESKVNWSNEKVNLLEMLLRTKTNDIIPIIYFSKKYKKIVKANIKLQDTTYYKIRKLYPPFEKVNYLVFGGLIMMNLTVNHIKIFPDYKKYYRAKNRLNKKLVLTKILPGSFVNRNRILSSGDIITKINNITVDDVESAKKAIIKPLISKGIKYIKIENENNNIFILKLSRILKEEQFLSKSHRYKKLNYII